LKKKKNVKKNSFTVITIFKFFFLDLPSILLRNVDSTEPAAAGNPIAEQQKPLQFSHQCDFSI
jgi:hypothetical protein